MNELLLFLQPVLNLLATDPVIRSMQIGVLSGGLVLVYLIFWVTKDSVNRSNSFLFILFSILLVACIPLFGFLAYLLIRPNKTLTEKQTLIALSDLKKEMESLKKQVSHTEQEVKKITDNKKEAGKRPAKKKKTTQK